MPRPKKISTQIEQEWIRTKRVLRIMDISRNTFLRIRRKYNLVPKELNGSDDEPNTKPKPKILYWNANDIKRIIESEKPLPL